ncbi:hypothetical protein KQX54_013189 [Cotesia glomerata]|uniref:Uncharacterized protein n=1 Tax=Cotesia glomerata TaxID=32391 RepID=A0AAV7IH43_COTGL|nr:hypothetical protein KQX54_013189 [Cotesia glomerata]
MDSNQLSPDWSSLSTDDKLTLVMKSVAQLPVLTTEFKTLSSKIDDLGSRLNMLQIEQSNTKEALNSINSNVNSNTTNIIQLRNELETIKEDTLKNSKSLADQHALISSVATSNDSSGVLPNYQVTSELVISGIPDSVVQGSSAIEITSSVFKALKVPELKTDILSSRCKKPVAKSIKCKTCKQPYHPSCAKLVVLSKAANCCPTSFASPHSADYSVPTTQNQFFLRQSSLSNLKCKDSIHSTRSTYKSANSSPKTPPVTLGDDSVFLSLTASNSVKMSELSHKTGGSSTEENLSVSIGLLKSTIDAMAGVSSHIHTVNQHISSELLISGVPDNVAVDKNPVQIDYQVFNKLGIANLTSDILSIRELNTKKKQGVSNQKRTSHLFILHSKSADVCHHIIDLKRRSPKLESKNIFDLNNSTASGGQIYINEFLHGEVYKLLQSTKTKTKDSKFKYVVTRLFTL